MELRIASSPSPLLVCACMNVHMHACVCVYVAHENISKNRGQDWPTKVFNKVSIQVHIKTSLYKILVKIIKLDYFMKVPGQLKLQICQQQTRHICLLDHKNSLSGHEIL